VDDPALAPFPLADLVPPELQGVLLNVTWDDATLFELPLAVEQILVGELRWQLDLRWWRDGPQYFAITPNQVRQDPLRYPAQWQRVVAADLACPIHVVENGGRLTVLDGVHRLLKADCERAVTIAARRLTMNDVHRIARRVVK
jgi:hypothetical protein